MEKNRRSKRFKVSPKHLKDHVTSFVSGKKPKLSVDLQELENITETVVEIKQLPEIDRLSNNEATHQSNDLQKNYIHVQLIEGPVNDSVRTSDDHFYCKKNDSNDFQSPTGVKSCEKDLLFTDQDVLDGKKEDLLNLQPDGPQTVKRKRGRPSKNLAACSPQSEESPDKENGTCCICNEKFVLTDVRSYRRFGLHTFVNQAGASPIQMINCLLDTDQGRFIETDEKNPSNQKQFLCYQCFSNLRGAYTSLVSMKDKMQSFLGRIKPQSVFKDKFFMKSIPENSDTSSHFSSDSAFRLCNNLEKKISSKENQADSDNYEEKKPAAKLKKSNSISSLYSLLNSVPGEDTDRSLIKCIITKHYNSFFKVVLKHPEFKQAYLRFLKSQIIKEVNDGINNKSSLLLQSFSEHSVHNFGWKQLQDEMDTMLPTLTTVLKSALFNKSLLNSIENDGTLTERLEEDFLAKTICLGNAMANIMYVNNKKMCLVQEANSVMMFHAGCTNWMMNTLHQLGYCVPSKSVKPYIDLRRQVKDIRMVKWRKKITKPRTNMKVLAYASGGISAKDLDAEDGFTYSKDNAPKGCKVVYIQGSKTSVCLRNTVESFYDSDEDHEDELRLPKLLGQKYERDVVDENISEADHSAEDTIANCQTALENNLNYLCEGKECKSMSSFGIPLEENSEEKVETLRAEHVESSNVLIQKLEQFPELTQSGEVMYLVMDNEQNAENILLDLHQAGFTTT